MHRAVDLSNSHEIRRSFNEGIYSPLALLVAVGLMATGYYFIPAIPEAWSVSGRLFFWCVLAALTVAAITQLIFRLLPEKARDRFKSLAQHRLVIPKEGLVYLVIMIVLFVGSLLGHTNMLMLVFAMMAGPFVINGWLAYHMLSSCQVHRNLPARAMSGELFSVELTLENTRPWLSLWMMELRDLASHPAESLMPSLLFSCVPGNSRRIGHYQMRLRRRGIYRFGPLTASSRFPLGLIERRRIFAKYGEIRVYPRIGRLTERARQRLLGSAELLSEQRSRPGSFHDEFHHLREYRAGDNPRAIHWRTSARRGMLVLRTFQQNREQHLAVVLDLWQPAYGATAENFERQEWALCLVATLCLEQRRRARDSRFSLYASGLSTVVWDGRTNAHGLDTLLDELAVIQAGPAAETAGLAQRAGQQSAAMTHLIVITTRQDGVERWYREEIQPGVQGTRMNMQLVTVDPVGMSAWVHFPEE